MYNGKRSAPDRQAFTPANWKDGPVEAQELTNRPGRPDLAAATREAVRGELDQIGRRLRLTRDEVEAELERLGAFLDVATGCGLRINEIAERAGVSRQTLANLRNKPRGIGLNWDVELRVLLSLGSQGLRSDTQLANDLDHLLFSAEEVREARKRLQTDGFVGWAGSAGYAELEDMYALTSEGAATIPGRLRYAAISAPRRWIAYVAIEDDRDITAIADAGRRSLGELAVGIVPRTTTYDMTHPELAFYVDASTREEALSAAAVTYRDLRNQAGLRANVTAHVTTLVPPSA
jgi:hypothetical protein